jgi:hypothetical protein
MEGRLAIDRDTLSAEMIRLVARDEPIVASDVSP